MFTLLPSEFRKDILLSYRKRVAIVLLIGILFITAISLTLTLSMDSYIKSIQSELKIKEAFLKKNAEDFSKKDLGVNIAELNQYMSILSLQSFRPTDLMSTIYKSVPQGILVERIEYMNFEVSKFMLTVSGKAPTRKTLSQFSENLRKQKQFQTVDLPIGVLAKDSDIAFSIKITGAYE